MVLFPPLNYCCVEAGIHRSGTPTQLNFPVCFALLKSFHISYAM